MLVAALATAASSFPSVARAQVLRPSEIRSRLQATRISLNRVADRLAVAERRLDEATAKATQHARALERAAVRERRIREALGRRAAELYMLGTTSELEALLGAQDPATFVDRFVYLEQVRSGERGLVEDLRTLRRRGRIERAELREAQGEARSVRNDLATRRRELEAKLREYSTLLRFLELAGGRTVLRASRRGPSGFACPVAGGTGVSDNFGDRRPGGPHSGVDLQANYGQRVVAVLPARVVDTPGGGWIGVGIVIRDLAGNEWWYAHLASRAVGVGEQVVPGQVIGRVGCSGRCYGPHLHFEWHPGGGGPKNPYRILRASC